MAGTNAYLAKKALRDLLRASSSLTGVQVEYAFPGLSRFKRECVYGGPHIAGPVNIPSFRGGTGTQPLKRDEKLTGAWHIWVKGPGNSIEANEKRATELGAAFEAIVATNPTLNGLTGLKLVQISEFDMSSEANDDESLTAVTYTLTYQSHNE